ncbi:hypothetical protein ACIA8G_35380 [Lentzea sp. NPDC051213]|uniref:hypothetical protein n=1 Tax=Lentzea sp. NPDC051213 TaxID=3364126 RepID=UPI0037ADD534
MAERDLTCIGAWLVLTTSVAALLSAGVINVLLAITESVLWPLVPGVGWPVIAAVVTALAQAATPSRSRTRHAARVPMDAGAPVRPW